MAENNDQALALATPGALPAGPGLVDTTASTFRLPGQEYLSGFASLPLLRQLGVMVGLASSVALGFSIVLWMQQPDYRPLTGEFEQYDVDALVQVLEQYDIQYKVDTDSSLVLVSADQIHRARIKVAETDLVSNGTVGFEMLDQESGFGTSHFMETARFRRSLEGELARTITSLNSVRRARVHLAIPKASSFIRDVRQASASVTLSLVPSRKLSPSQVKAIMNLVAGAVPELPAEKVTVVDQSGNLLSAQLEEQAGESTEKQLAYRQKIEEETLRKIRNILLPAVGEDRFSAEVSADVDFTWMEQTEERFDPNAPAIRSEATLEEQRVGEVALGGVPGALVNQPPAVANAPELAGQAQGNGLEATPGRSRKQATRNYEVDRTISHRRFAVGELRRLTVSVLIDDMPVTDPQTGVMEYQPWQQAELQRIEQLVRHAVGFNASRGDLVTVVNTPFVIPVSDPEQETPWWQQSWLLDMSKQLAGLLVLLILAFTVIRPLIRGTAFREEENKSAEEFPALPDLATDFDEDRLENALDDVVSLGGNNAAAGGGVIPAGAVTYNSQLEAIRALIAEDPARVAEVVRGWVSNDE